MSPAASKIHAAIFLQRYWGNKMTFVERQINGLSKYFDMCVLAPVDEDKSKRPFPVYVKEKNIIEKVYSGIRKKYFTRYTNISFSQKAYWGKVITENKIKLIQAHFGPAGIQVLPLAKEHNIPLLVTIHGYDASMLLRNNVYVSNLRDMFKYEKIHIIPVSDFIKKKLIGLGAPEDKITINYCGIPVEEFQFVKREPIREKFKSGKEIKFLQIANFSEKKGHVYTVRAFKKLTDQYPNCTLTLAGSGPLKEEIEALCKTEGISGKVIFPGGIPSGEVFNYLKEHDVFLHHSITGKSGDQEGIPNSIMEAMSTGMPAISTYHSGIPELIEDGVSGFLVEEKDVEGYCKKMEAVLSADEQINQKAHEKVDNDFNLVKQVEKLKTLYCSLIK